MKTNVLRRNATTLVLLGAAAALGAYVFFVDRGKPSTAELQSRRDRLLPVFRKSQVSRIELTVEGHRAVLRRIDGSNDDRGVGRWTLSIDEVSYDADNEAVADLLRGLNGARKLREVSPATDPKTTGLASPKIRLRIHMGAVDYDLSLGSPAPAPKGSVYVKVQGAGLEGQTFVMDKLSVGSVAKPIESYRSRNIVSLLMQDVARVSIADEQGKRVFVRSDWGFRLDGLQGPRVSPSMLDRLTDSLADLTAKQFVDVAQARRSQRGKSTVVVSLDPTKKAEKKGLGSFSVRIGGPCPINKDHDGPSSQLVVALRTKPSPLAACVEQSVLTSMRPRPEAFVDRHLLAAKPSEIEEIRVQAGNHVVELARRGHGWHQQQPTDRNLSLEEGDTYAKSLLQIEGVWVANPPDDVGQGWDSPRSKLTITTSAPEGNSRPQQTVLVGETDESTGNVWVKRLQDGAVLRVNPSGARLLQPSLALLRSPQLLDVVPTRVKWVQVSVEGKRRQRVERKGGTFAFAFPVGYDVDAALAHDLFENAARLRAVRWVADKDDGHFGLSHPYAEVSFFVRSDDANDTKHLLIGDVGMGGRYARWEPDSGVFVLSQAVVRGFINYVIDRSPFMLDPSETASVRLESSTAEVTMIQSGDSWIARDGHGKALSQPTADRLQEALIALRAEGVVHLGAPRPSEGLNQPVIDVVVKGRKTGHFKKIHWRVGRADVWNRTNVMYARRDDIDATFAVARSRLDPLLDVLQVDTTD